MKGSSCGMKKMGAKKGYKAGGVAKCDTAKKKPSKGNPFEMMMKAKGRNMAKASKGK